MYIVLDNQPVIPSDYYCFENLNPEVLLIYYIGMTKLFLFAHSFKLSYYDISFYVILEEIFCLVINTSY